MPNESQQSACRCQPRRRNSCATSTAASWAGLQVVLLHPCRSLNGIFSTAHERGFLQGKQPGTGPPPHRGDRSGGRQCHARLLGMMDCRGGSCSLQAQRLQACPSYSCQVLQTPKWFPRIGSRFVRVCCALWCIQACCQTRGCGPGSLQASTARARGSKLNAAAEVARRIPHRKTPRLLQVKLPLDPGVVLLDIAFTETDPNRGETGMPTACTVLQCPQSAPAYSERHCLASLHSASLQISKTISAHAGFLLGTRQTLLETTDGGKSWNPRRIEAAQDEGFNYRSVQSLTCIVCWEDWQPAAHVCQPHSHHV